MLQSNEGKVFGRAERLFLLYNKIIDEELKTLSSTSIIDVMDKKIIHLRQKPYYENDNSILYLGDTSKLLPKIETNSIDMIFADPPYFLSDGGISCSGGAMVSVGV